MQSLDVGRIQNERGKVWLRNEPNPRWAVAPRGQGITRQSRASGTRKVCKGSARACSPAPPPSVAARRCALWRHQSPESGAVPRCRPPTALDDEPAEGHGMRAYNWGWMQPGVRPGRDAASSKATARTRDRVELRFLTSTRSALRMRRVMWRLDSGAGCGTQGHKGAPPAAAPGSRTETLTSHLREPSCQREQGERQSAACIKGLQLVAGRRAGSPPCLRRWHRHGEGCAAAFSQRLPPLRRSSCPVQ